jgi:hypothetical protein
MGLVPVLVLALALVTSVVIGLRLGRPDSSRRVADELGCTHVSSSASPTGVRQETCTYHGGRIIIWSFGHGSNVVYPVSWMENGVEGPSWIVGCRHAADCLAIQRRLGGRLLGRAWLGSSIEAG